MFPAPVTAPWIQPGKNVSVRPGSCETSLRFVLQKTDTMKEVDNVHQNTESLSLEEKVQMKQLGVHQAQDVGRPQTAADVRPLEVMKEKVPWSPSTDQQTPEPVRVKEEEEELWISREGGYDYGLDENEYSRLPLTVIVKTEDEEEEPQTSQLQQSQTDAREVERPTSSFKWIKKETDGEDWGRLELVRKPRAPRPKSGAEGLDTPETEFSEEDDWQEPLSETDSGCKGSRATESGIGSDNGCSTVKKPFSCPECGKQFLYRQSLKRHMRRNIEKSSNCSVNLKCSEVKQNADSKTKVHTGKKNFSCDMCGKSFRDHFSLKSHMRVHSEEKPFGCEICAKCFKHEHNLKIHMRIHTGEMPFSCEVCGKRFKHQHNLKTHMRIHTGEKPFVCDICGKRARHQNNLKTHMIVHRGERPFGCDLCENQHLWGKKNEISWKVSLGQQDAFPFYIKEEEEEHWISQEGDELLGGDEAEYAKFPINVIVKDEEEPESSQLHQSQTNTRETEPPTSSSFKWIKTETDGEDWGHLELISKSDPNNFKINKHRMAADSLENEASENEDNHCYNNWHGPIAGTENRWKGSQLAEAGMNSDAGCNASKKVFSCSECGKQFLDEQSLRRHMRRNTEKNSSDCSVIQKCSEVKKNADSQAKVHTGKKNFSCEICGKTFRDHFSLTSHIRVHTGEQPFGCDVCGKRFKHQHDVKKHMRVHTGEMPFCCEVCGKRFKHQHNLKTHMRIHTGEKPYVCDICGKRSRFQHNLKTHMIIHTGERLFDCDLCGKKFTCKKSLKAHESVHTGEKPHSCEICGKSYKRKTHLRTHMTSHTEERPFGCEVCGKRFNRKTYLETHMAVHTGEKPYSCDFCGKRFTRKTHLDSHIIVHTGEKPFGCAVCGQEFTQQGSLDRHMTLHLG